jgi:macrocin-O-methyltransferase TylF-like protien
MKDSFQDHTLPKNDPHSQFKGHPIISDQITREGLAVVYGQLQDTIKHGVPGAVVEFGCYAGTTSLFIRRLLDQAKQSAVRPFHVYDSFEGLPPKGPQDSNAAGVDFEAGKLYASKKEFMQQFRNANLRLPIIHKGWFNQLSGQDLPQQVAFAFLDGDFYGSIISSLRLVWPRMDPGGKILIDDYQRETLPGVERAASDFLRDKKFQGLRVECNIAIIKL